MEPVVFQNSSGDVLTALDSYSVDGLVYLWNHVLTLVIKKMAIRHPFPLLQWQIFPWYSEEMSQLKWEVRVGG